MSEAQRMSDRGDRVALCSVEKSFVRQFESGGSKKFPGRTSSELSEITEQRVMTTTYMSKHVGHRDRHACV